MKRIIIGILVIFYTIGISQTENIAIQKIEPPFWWCGMHNTNLQILVYGQEIGQTEAAIEYPGLILLETQKVENPNYVFLNIRLDKECKPGKFDIHFQIDGKDHLTWEYELLDREEGSAQRMGFDPSDVLYLLMPDRFSNGDPSNDQFRAMLEAVDRSNPDGRHGGDIQGIMNHLDYISESGYTGLWINPLVENNNPEKSYHGYAITDFYNVDIRYGRNEDYVNLVQQCHEKDLKVVMDVIFNHSSVYNWLIKDLPSHDWIHHYETYTASNFRAPTIMDPHASEYDKKKMLTGWFDRHMADLNQQNPLLATYLIQNTIWWIEYSGIDGIRVDTQPYSYKEFISNWGKAIFDEYPNFNVVGEAWLQKEAFTAYFQKGSRNKDGYDSNIPSVTDFPMYFAMQSAFNEKETWTEGLLRIYYVLAHDYLYGDPFQNLIFVDNHDVNRFYSNVNGNLDRWKMAMVILSTMRGIPCIYYGTEILMTGLEHDGHGQIRKDFPGGWKEDERNAFIKEGRTADENEAYNFLKNLLNWRKTQDVIHSGNIKHFLPEDNVYVYFRYTENECVMVALNNSENELKAIDHKRFAESINGYSAGINVITGETINYLDTFTIPPKSALVLELKK